jgi:hypothetical protein
MEVFVRRLISAAVTVLVAGLSVPGVVSTAHATAPARPVTAACSITTPSGDCYQAGEFCSRAELGESTTDAGGAAIHCVQDSGFRRWLGTGTTPATGTSTTATGNSATGQGGPGTGGTAAAGTTQVLPLGGVSAGGGGLALSAADAVRAAGRTTAARHTGSTPSGLPVGLAGGALAAGLGGVLVVRRRRAADGR